MDYIWKRPIVATILRLPKDNENELMLSERLPEGYSYHDGFFSFPAGFKESLILDGIDYNSGEVDLPLELQKETAIKELKEKGFETKEIEELLDGLKIREGNTRFLNHENSLQWLDLHPEFKEEAIKILNESRQEVQNEIKETRSNVKRK